MKFWKLDGAGNDFVLVERGTAALARAVCDRRRGVGADGLLVVDRRRRSFVYYNADGSETFCGNGARCAALWLGRAARAPREFVLRGESGPQKARILGSGRAALTMPTPVKKGKLWLSGVPHLVIPVKDVRKVDVVGQGRPLRKKWNANVDFIQRKGKTVLMRTYERGVENETLACGTGATASAFAALELGWGRLPLQITTNSGQPLTVTLKDGETWLEGPARIVFTGELR